MDNLEVNDGAKIAYQYVDGHQPPIAFIHGAHISSREWQPQLEAVNGQAHLLIDLRGHGQSERKGQPYSIPQFASDVAQVCDHLQLDQLIVCGHSLGGMVVQQLVADRPDLVSGLILADTSYGVRATKVEAFFANISLPFFKLVPTSMQVEVFVNSLGKFSAETKQYVTEEISKHAANQQSYRSVWSAVFDFDGASRLADIACKTLILVGRQNKQTHQQAQTMQSRIADAELIYIEVAGHMLNWDNPDQFNQVLTEFVQQIRSSLESKSYEQ